MDGRIVTANKEANRDGIAESSVGLSLDNFHTLHQTAFSALVLRRM
jgi:hypothetical protein